MQRLKIIVSGDVQGVGYRWRCYELAKRYNLTGYAKNLKDKTVEVVVEGDERFVEEFKSHLPNMPGYTEKVDEIESTEIEKTNHEKFEIM